MKRNEMIVTKARRIVAILAAAFATMFATSAARATDLESNCMFAAESDALYIYRGFSLLLY